MVALRTLGRLPSEDPKQSITAEGKSESCCSIVFPGLRALTKPLRSLPSRIFACSSGRTVDTRAIPAQLALLAGSDDFPGA